MKYFIPASSYDDPENLRQAKIAVSVYLINAFLDIAYFYNGVLLGFVPFSYLVVFCGLGYFLSAFLFKWGYSNLICATLFGVVGIFQVGFLIYFSGGIDSPPTVALILIPLYNLLLTSNRRSALSWFIFILLIFIALAYKEYHFGAFSIQYDLTQKYHYQITTIVGMFVNIFVIVLIFDFEKSNAIHSLIRINDNLKSTQNQLIQKEKLASLGELTAGIAHEIQNPLNFVNNFSELSVELLEELLSDITQNLNKINFHGKRASGIVKAMLEHSRSSSGEREPTDINQLADEYLRLAYHGLRAKNKDFNADYELVLDKNMPLLKVVSQDIGRVLLNLINNAFQSPTSSEGGIKKQHKVIVKTFRIEANSSSPFAGGGGFMVSDNGAGIPAEIMPKIFQPFFTTKPTGEGTGLGLSLSYEIITKGHGGTIEAKSIEGEGATFVVKLPL